MMSGAGTTVTKGEIQGYEIEGGHNRKRGNDFEGTHTPSHVYISRCKTGSPIATEGGERIDRGYGVDRRERRPRYTISRYMSIYMSIESGSRVGDLDTM